MLTKILASDLPIYRRLYQLKWPKYLVTCGLLDHFIDRFQKFPEWEEKVQFLKLEGSEINDATFVFINEQHIYFDTLEEPPFDKLNSLMNKLDYSEEKVFIGVRDAFRPFLDDLIRIHHLERTFDLGTRCMLTIVKMTPEILRVVKEGIE
jgi:hypothetical protein